MSEYFSLPNVSIQLLLCEGVNVPEHVRHLPDVSPPLQVLAMGFFLGSLRLSEGGGKWCLVSWLFADALLMDRHWARDSICLGVYVDGVCAVGCNRQKVLAALEAVKATLDAAGSQIHPSKFSQVFSWITRPGYCRWKLLEFGGCDVAWRLPRAKDILRATRMPN